MFLMECVVHSSSLYAHITIHITCGAVLGRMDRPQPEAALTCVVLAIDFLALEPYP